MAKVVNVKTEQKKKELRGLLEQVDVSSWDSEPGDSPLSQFIREGEEYKEAFIKKHDLPNDDEVILYEICNELKKKTKKKANRDMCWLSSIASTIIIELSAGHKCVKNDFYIKTSEICLNNDNWEEELYYYLVKHSKYWFNEIQTALKTKNYDLLMNSMPLMSSFSSYCFHLCPKA